MWSRPDLKQRGKTAFFGNYWCAVAVAFIAAIAAGTFGGNGNGAREYVQNRGDFDYEYGHGIVEGTGSLLLTLIFSIVFLVIFIVVLAVRIFLGNPLTVGGNRFFMENREHRTPVSTIFYSFRSGKYGNIVVTLFLRDLYVTLWTLLFIVPGVIKSYEYCMVPYLLSENPGMDRHQAFAISRQMMDGQKMEAFVLDLSFIGWNILSALSCGLVGIFFADPYRAATWAELYAVYRAHAFHSGALTPRELPGFGIGHY